MPPEYPPLREDDAGVPVGVEAPTPQEVVALGLTGVAGPLDVEGSSHQTENPAAPVPRRSEEAGLQREAAALAGQRPVLVLQPVVEVVA